MKTFILKLTCLLTLVISFNIIYAQQDITSKKIGLVAGTTFSRVSNAHNPSETRISPLAGAFFIIPFSQSCYCAYNNYGHYLQTQMEYSQLGEKGDGNTLYADNYINFLFMYRFSIKYNEYNSLFVSIGPKISALIHQEVKNPPAGKPYAINAEGKANPFDVGITLMGGINFNNSKTDLFLRGDCGLFNRYPFLYDGKSSVKNKNQYSIAIGLGYVVF